MPAPDGLVRISETTPTGGDSAPNKGVQLTARSLRERSGFRQQLTPCVDMTSDVKSWVKIVDVFIRFSPC
jgi:hypothetical protein